MNQTVVRNAKEAEDEGLILACRRGDAAAWEALVYRYQRLIYTIPRRTGLDEDLCAEVFQRTFTKLFEHLERLEQPARVRAWLVTTAGREARRLRQRQQAVQPLTAIDQATGDLSETELCDPTPLPDEVLLQLEEQHLVRVTVAELDERCRKLLTLLYYDPASPSYTEIAIACNIPEGSLGPTRARCLRKLQQLLQKIGF